MIKKIQVLIAILLLTIISIQAQNFPFPQHTEYATHIKPSQYTQQQLDDHVKSFYDGWKNKYLKQGCEDNQYYVYFASGNTITVSEAMGYGMLIIPLMAGYDENARMYFNGLYRYYKAHPSHVMPHLMAWKQITGCIDADGPDSASDGDIDIAFGLLLAHAQWGSRGAINYFQEALAIINDIMGENASQGDINQDFYSIKLGDWVQSGSYMDGTRTSDFVMDHYRAFACAVKDTNWNSVVNTCYDLVADMQTNYSPETGLLPDFIVDLNASPKPADPDYLEGELDGNYSYNACRDPWRLASDYLINGEERAQEAVIKINRWLIEASGESVQNIRAGYYLNGDPAVGWSDISFTAPFTVGAMLDTTNQEWLNKLYSKILTSNIAYGGYYDNTLKLLSLITISGNYWVPDCNILNGINSLNATVKPFFNIQPVPAKDKLSIRLKDATTNIHYFASVIDLSGRSVFTSKATYDTELNINVLELKNGIYFLNIIDTNTGNIIERKKFIITK